MSFYLAADIGGTKTILALYNAHQGVSAPFAEQILPSRDFNNFSSLLRHFLADKNISISQACFGVAGPVRENRVSLTNLPWHMTGSEIETEFAISRVTIINDLVALASSIGQLQIEELHILHQGIPDKKGTKGVVAPGTGLGMSFLIRHDRKFLAGPSEGGHAGFSPRSVTELRLLQYLHKKKIDPSFESLCSGSGLPHIYDFLAKSDRFSEPGQVKINTEPTGDPTPLIINGAMDSEAPCPLCMASVRLFVQVLAEACRNLALTVMATGGIYLAGGLPARILPFLQDGFQQRFMQGKMSGLLQNMPITVIMTPKAGLIGAAAYMDNLLS